MRNKIVILKIFLPVIFIFFKSISAQPQYYETENLTIINQYIPENNNVFEVDIYKNYAFISRSINKLEILDISNVVNIVQVKIIERDFKYLEIVNNYAYAFGASKLKIFNLDNLPSFKPIMEVDLRSDYGNISVGENYIFHYYSFTFTIISLENPANPEIKGSIQIPSTIYGVVYISSGIVYLGCLDGLRIIDVSNPSAPTISGFTTSLGSPLAAGLLLNGYLIINKVFSAQLLVVDIQDPFNPKEIWYYNYYGNGFINKICKQGDFIFASSPEKNAYLEMFNINDFSSHIRTGYFANRLRGSGGGIVADENYIYYSGISNNDAPEANGNGGLFILKNDLISSVEEQKQLLIKFNLSQNYPNPFNPSTIIKYTIPLNEKRETKNVKLVVYDVQGEEKATLVNKKQNSGNYQVEFDGSNLPSGVYFYRLQADGFRETKKMILLR